MLSRYALDEVDTEEKRKKIFMKGLNPFMKMQLRLTKPKEFQELVDAVITLEDDYKLLSGGKKEEGENGTKEVSSPEATTKSTF